MKDFFKFPLIIITLKYITLLKMKMLTAGLCDSVAPLMATGASKSLTVLKSSEKFPTSLIRLFSATSYRCEFFIIYILVRILRIIVLFRYCIRDSLERHIKTAPTAIVTEVPCSTESD